MRLKMLGLGAGLMLAAVSPRAADAAELLMLHQPGCAWCVRFEAEIAPAYPKTREGAIAPIRRIDISSGWPSDLGEIQPERFTPTFILLENGKEVDRMRGYVGDEFFWYLLGEMIAKLPAEKQRAAQPEG